MQVAVTTEQGHEVPEPFRTYFRMVRQEKHVAEVTLANIGQIAALIGGQVDYSKGVPELLVPRESGLGPLTPWGVKIGWQLSLMISTDRDGKTRYSVMNENGFRRDGRDDDWHLV